MTVIPAQGETEAVERLTPEEIAAELIPNMVLASVNDPERRQLRVLRNGIARAIAVERARIAALEADRSRAVEVLGPFAAAADMWFEMGDTRPINADGILTVAHLRAAATVLKEMSDG